VRETFAPNAPALREGQTRVVVDAQYPAPDRHWEQNHNGNGTPGPPEGQEKETAVRLVNPQNNLVNSPIESSYVLPPSKRALPQPEGPMSVAHSVIPRASATASQGQARPRESRQVNDGQSLGEPSVARRRSGLPEPCGSVQAQKPSGTVIFGPAERPQIAGENTPPILTVQEPDHEPAPIQRRSSDKCHPTKVATEDEASRRGRCVQDPFPDISWEGWGLIRTPNGIYLPETFNPFPQVFEDLTDQW